MEASTWICIMMPLIIAIFIGDQHRRIACINNKKKRGKKMANELVEKYLGKTCLVSTGSFGSAFKGKITVVKDNWIEITDKKGSKILNLDYVTHISTLKEQ